MKLLERIVNNEKKCKRFLGLGNQQINKLEELLVPLWEEHEKIRLSRKPRKREIGAGRKYKLSLKFQIVVCLLYYKMYLTQEFVGLISEIDQSSISRITSNLSRLIEQAADPKLADILQTSAKLQNGDRIKNFVELREKCPEVADIISDATETRCNRPCEKELQKKFYSGKRKTHTLKTQISINSNKQILNVSNTYPGSVHDKKILECEKTIKKFPTRSRHTLDKGYTGVDRENPEYNILIPFKKRRGIKELSSIEKQLNKFLSKLRIPVEHVLSRLKNFRICSYKYRGRREDFNQIFRNIAAIYNFNLSTS